MVNGSEQSTRKAGTYECDWMVAGRQAGLPVVVQGSGHYVLVKCPALVVREVQEFVEHVRDRAIPGSERKQTGPQTQTE